MKMNLSKMFFLSFMMVGVMMCLCSNNWLFIWCGLELSLISFLPLMQGKLIITSESVMKYFLVQSVSSGVLILGLMMMMSKIINYDMMISLAILIKAGIAPFHLWLLTVIEGLYLMPMILIFTISKVAPLMILSMMKMSLTLIISLTLLTGAILGLNQTSIRKMIAYSSIFNIGLMLMSVKSNFIWCYYLLVYSILLITLLFSFYKMNMFYVNQIISSEGSIHNKTIMWMTLLSMGGMPPLLGFSIKLIVIEFSLNNFMMINLVLIILLSLLVMFFYLRMAYLTLMFYSSTPKWMTMKTTKLSLILLSVNFLTLPLVLTYKVFY
uniref:NADH-ubiquinone oxidoreductase chain 2 n=1 Tax=Seriana sp. 'barna' TaxID=3003638 RepID=A0A9E9J141_9HEMI|nr:NADH dehydrogenase subunit 2 [Seriana sp. 'barna']